MIEFLAYGVVFAAEALIAWIYFEYLFEHKARADRRIFTFAVGYLALWCVSSIGSTMLNVTAFTVVNLLLLTINYTGRYTRFLLRTGFLSFAMLASELLVTLLLNFFVRDFSAYTYRPAVWIALAVLSKLLYFLIAVTTARMQRARERRIDETATVLMLCALPVASIIIAVTLVYVGMEVRMNAVVELLMLCSVLLLLLINILVLLIYNRMQKLAEERMEMQLALQREEAHAEYYALLKDQYESQRILVHDLRNHLQVLHDLKVGENSEAIAQYAARMLDDPALSRVARLSDDPILNILLLRYAGDCKARGIQLTCDIRDHCTDMLIGTETTMIFGNLLSNAVEAAEQSDEKRIELSAIYRAEQQAVVITLVNSCVEAPRSRADGSFISRKANPSKHGIGMKSIAKAVKRHRGTIHTHYNALTRCFHLSIALPSPKKEGDFEKGDDQPNPQL